jgi:hypothetical protein
VSYFRLSLYHYAGIIALIIALIPLAVFLNDYIEEFEYDRKSHLKGCGIPFKRLDRPFGIARTLQVYRAVRNYELEPVSIRNFAIPGVHTIRGSGLLSKMFFTIDPENIKTVLSTNFKDYYMGARYVGMHPLPGDGIFSLSGDGGSILDICLDLNLTETKSVVWIR